jgi:hypothetical protein
MAAVHRCRLSRFVGCAAAALLSLPGARAQDAVPARPPERGPVETPGAEAPILGRGEHRRFWDVPRPPGVPDDATLEAEGAVIGEIHVRALDIFDTEQPEEDQWAFRAANRLHAVTRPRVVRQQLLFRAGDRYSARVIEESERALRNAPFFYDARVRPVAYRDGAVDVEVLTRDVWTLSLALGFSREGGENATRVGIADSNFLGTGKDLTFRRDSDVDRTSQLYRYRDRHLRGTRWALLAAYSDNSDGSLSELAVERPFYSLDARWAASALGLDDDRRDPLYRRGDAAARYRHRERILEVSAGFSRGLVRGRALRLRSGYTYDRDRFSDFALEPGMAWDGPVPADRTLGYPWVELSSVADAFIAVTDLDRLQRTEDVNLGLEWTARAGLSSPATGGDSTRWIGSASLQAGSRRGERDLLRWGASLRGRLRDGRTEAVLAGASARYYRRFPSGHVFYASLSGDVARRLDAEDQLLLGGDNGLRGYPLRYVEGDRRALLVLEQRLYTDWHVLRLLHVGAAAFVDVGRAWFDDPARRAENLGWLRDVGIGLRIGSSRSARAALVHFDFAMPLDGGADRKDVQFLVTTKDTF